MPLITLLGDDEIGKKKTPVSRYPHLKFKGMTHFNRIQSAVLREGLPEKDCNLVLATKTSTGKTVVAEMLAAPALNEGKKVLYVSPLKALTQEKYDEWERRFAEHSILIMTGDYTLSKNKERRLQESHLICMTSEMLDSRTRNTDKEGAAWMQDVGVVIVDEAHILGTERGPAVEVGLMRFCSMAPQARVLLLSATMPNVRDMAEWCCVLNNKDTVVVQSTWRPVPIDLQLKEYREAGNYGATRMQKVEHALDLAFSKPKEKYLCFVHEKTTGKILVDKLREEGERTARFHSADEDLKTRSEIESRFRKRSGRDAIRVLVSTSTLAWGCNLPARNVVIVGVTRGFSAVSTMDLIQMMGRAGRVGLDKKGFCTVLVPEFNASRWALELNTPPAVLSGLMNSQVLSFHLLAEVKHGARNERDLQQWYRRSLAYFQGPYNEAAVKQALKYLRHSGFLQEELGEFRLTPFGEMSVELYFTPQDISWWRFAFSVLKQNHMLRDRYALAWAVGRVPSAQLGYIPRGEQKRVNEFHSKLHDHLEPLKKAYPPDTNSQLYEASLTVADVYDTLCGRSTYTVGSFGLRRDMDRITALWLRINAVMGIDSPQFFQALALRVRYAVPQKHAHLCRLAGVGPVYARRLYRAGVKSVRDAVSKSGRKKVTMIMGTKAKRAIDSAQKIIEEEAQC